ncbi:hypothetical protein BpHYR1_047011 [Brachionus plicatilis]|uniref:Uncharacterized protein n=1 Tax=Brachionus plicatilis TaxID=10195 RepID=A0A3M7S4K5_BRAPC|nr:hypothetical protein BpHYR1_047011 [Brachionus plicatilis]
MFFTIKKSCGIPQKNSAFKAQPKIAESRDFLEIFFLSKLTVLNHQIFLINYLNRYQIFHLVQTTFLNKKFTDFNFPDVKAVVKMARTFFHSSSLSTDINLSVGSTANEAKFFQEININKFFIKIQILTLLLTKQLKSLIITFLINFMSVVNTIGVEPSK